MTTTAAELVQQSFYLANVKDPEEALEGYEISQGLNLLNAIITQWSSLSVYIPAYTLLPINTVAGTYLYTLNTIIVDLLEASYYDSANIKYDLAIIDLKRQNTLNYQDTTVQLRPNLVFPQNDQSTVATQTTKIFLYPIPNDVYNVTLYAKTFINTFDYSDELTTLPAWYFKVLKYQLANDLSTEYETVLPARFDKEYDKLIKELKATTKKDFSVQNRNIFRTFRRFRPWGGYVG